MSISQQSQSSLRDNHARGKAGEFVKAHVCTDSGADMRHCDGLVKKCLESIVHTFTKRAAASLFSGRDGKLPSAEETPKELESEYELLTWLVIMDPTASS